MSIRRDRRHIGRLLVYASQYFNLPERQVDVRLIHYALSRSRQNWCDGGLPVPMDAVSLLLVLSLHSYIVKE